MVAPPQVIIDLKHKPKEDGDPGTSYDGDPLATGTDRNIKVTRSEEPSGSNFLKFTHQDKNSLGTPFNLEKILDDESQEISLITTGNKVTSVSAYYWRHKTTKALLVGVVDGTRKNRYYRNSKGGNWETYPKIESESPTQSDLELLNCEVNDAVTIDLSYETSTAQKSYCCEKHKKGGSQGKVTVDKQEVFCRQSDHNSSRIPYHKHTVSGPETQIAAIYYMDGGQRKSIKISENQASYLWCQSVYVFYCDKQNPVLIYIGSQSSMDKGWYKKNTGDTWEPFSGISENITPENINSCGKEFNELVKELQNSGCSLSQCTPVIPPPTAQPPAKLFVLESATSIGVTVSSVFGGAGGLTGLGLWAFKRSRGDPWVRQI